MKLNQKFFLLSFILIMILILVLGVFMLQYTFHKNVDQEIESSIHTYNNILNSIYAKLEEEESHLYYSSMPSHIEAQDLSKILATILDSYEIAKNSIPTFLYQDANLLFANHQEPTSELLNKIYCEDYHLHTYITEINNEHTLLTYSKLQIEEIDYWLITNKNIEDIYNIRQEQSSSFMYLGLILGLSISVILYILSYLITKKIATINTAAKEIASGNYHTRIPSIHGNDEVNELALSFNTMASSIESYITQIHNDSKAKQDFIDNFLHELRTPITNIKISSSLLSTGVISIKNEQKYAEKLIEINEEIDYIHNMTTKLIDIFLLKIDFKNLPSINFSKLLSNICKKERKKLEKYPIQIITKIEPNIIKQVDPDLIKSLITNILNNSFRAYSKKKGKIEITLSNDLLKVTDYGKGIPKEELDKIIQPFYTLNQSRNKELSGIGLRCTIM